MPINCNQPNVYQYGESWTPEANEYHTLCAAYRTTSLNTKYQETVYQIAAAPADSHGGDHTAQFVAASQGGGGGGRWGGGGGRIKQLKYKVLLPGSGANTLPELIYKDAPLPYV